MDTPQIYTVEDATNLMQALIDHIWGKSHCSGNILESTIASGNRDRVRKCHLEQRRQEPLFEEKRKSLEQSFVELRNALYNQRKGDNMPLCFFNKEAPLKKSAARAYLKLLAESLASSKALQKLEEKTRI